MKAIGIIGYKKSGKTTLALALAKALRKRNYRVAIIKHSSQPLNRDDTDTGKFIREVSQVAIITPEYSEIILKGIWDLRKIASFFSADFLILEGFKKKKYFPKIICLRREEEKDELNDGLALFTTGMDSSLKKQKIIDYCILDEKDIKEITDQIEKMSFMLPDINCGKCGYQNCHGLAQAIIKGSSLPGQCVYFQNNVSIYINHKKVSLNPFMSRLYQNTIQGMLSPLKEIDSVDNASIEIKLDPKGVDF